MSVHIKLAIPYELAYLRAQIAIAEGSSEAEAFLRAFLRSIAMDAKPEELAAICHIIFEKSIRDLTEDAAKNN